ncbi:MAG: secondary thiamine-phosphate synthase enzyme YjbQ [Deltaproteobacteria bacterium]|jgi:secondary thiamine-phosphate synthase enzyme|nr:secondary thiamine-phosphate synthase enzyme YjbQ [Deltaproteobacteria bacterium]
MQKQLTVKSGARSEMIDITGMVRSVIRDSRVEEGICYVFVPHTTAAVTINENADPDVPRDIGMAMDKAIPWQDHYSHREGNAAAHVKASLMGASEMVFIENGNPVLGTWQSIFFCEFDGPRTRKILVKVVKSRQD